MEGLQRKSANSMKDWKGNEICQGDIAVVVNTGSIFDGAVPVMTVIKDDKEHIFKGEPLKKQYLWEPSSRYLITEPGNVFSISLNDKPSTIPINHVDSYLTTQPWQILCIEGKSDNQDEYYREYFNEQY